MLSLNERCTNLLDDASHVILLEGLIRDAAVKHSPYPQYSGHFDDWILCLVTETVAFKGSSLLPEGRIVLASRTVTLTPGTPASRSTYCTDTGHVVATPHEHIRPLTLET